MTVHMSKPTALLADMLLPSSARLQKRRQKEGSTSAAPVFDTEQAEALSYLYELHDLDTDFPLDGEKEVTGRFYHAGHVLGAVGLYIEGEDDGRQRRVFYTADTSVKPQTIPSLPTIPRGPSTCLPGDDARRRHRSGGDEPQGAGAAFGEALSRASPEADRRSCRSSRSAAARTSSR